MQPKSFRNQAIFTARFAPDGRWALVIVPTTPARLMLYPTGPGEFRRLDAGELEAYSEGRWFDDGKSIFICGNAAGMNNVNDIALVDDSRGDAYTAAECSSRLFQIEGGK